MTYLGLLDLDSKTGHMRIPNKMSVSDFCLWMVPSPHGHYVQLYMFSYKKLNGHILTHRSIYQTLKANAKSFHTSMRCLFSTNYATANDLKHIFGILVPQVLVLADVYNDRDISGIS